MRLSEKIGMGAGLVSSVAAIAGGASAPVVVPAVALGFFGGRLASAMARPCMAKLAGEGAHRLINMKRNTTTNVETGSRWDWNPISLVKRSHAALRNIFDQQVRLFQPSKLPAVRNVEDRIKRYLDAVDKGENYTPANKDPFNEFQEHYNVDMRKVIQNFLNRPFPCYGLGKEKIADAIAEEVLPIIFEEIANSGIDLQKDF